MKIDDQTREALASYTGLIMRCRPGKARGHAVKPQPLPDSVSKKVSLSIVHEAQCMKHDAAAQWLSEHRDIVPVIDGAERRRRKKARARWQRQRQARKVRRA
jgi:hypothetical protein